MKLILSVFIFKTSDESVKPNKSTSHFVLVLFYLQNEKEFNKLVLE